MQDGHCTSAWKWPRPSRMQEPALPVAGSGWFTAQGTETRPHLLIRPFEEVMIVDFLNAQAIAGDQ